MTSFIFVQLVTLAAKISITRQHFNVFVQDLKRYQVAVYPLFGDPNIVIGHHADMQLPGTLQRRQEYFREYLSATQEVSGPHFYVFSRIRRIHYKSFVPQPSGECTSPLPFIYVLCQMQDTNDDNLDYDFGVGSLFDETRNEALGNSDTHKVRAQ